MRNFKGQAMAAAIGVIALGSVGMGAAAAADMVPEAELQAPSPEYYPNPRRYYSEPPAQLYERPPVAYRYAPPPAYYAYGPRPGVVVVPEAYYPRRHYGPVYGGRPYGFRGYAPHVARGYGGYDRRWDRGHYRW
jgi:hypothetical protein